MFFVLQSYSSKKSLNRVDSLRPSGAKAPREEKALSEREKRCATQTRLSRRGRQTKAFLRARDAAQN
jgi:hypothetical protein